MHGWKSKKKKCCSIVIIQGVLDNYAYIEDYLSIHKEVELHQESPLYSDPFRLKVILNNLISNALRYSQPEYREAFVKISAQVNPQELVLTIEDNGQGIPAKHTPRIFEMFYLADNRKAGSGLRLYIVKETVEKLNGSIEVYSEIEKGTAFRVYIPNARAEEATDGDTQD
jgi:signal transduction histidine kinase